MSQNPGNFPRFLQALCLASFAMGIQSLLFPWLIVGELGASSDATGAAIMLSMLPATFLLLWGGAYSDGRHLGRLLLRLYVFLLLPYSLLLACQLWLGWSYAWVLFFGVSFGVINSFVQPARESLLGAVALPPLQSSVAKAMIAQSFGMGAGALAGGVLIKHSLLAVIILQMLLLVATGFLMRSSSPGIVTDKGKAKSSAAGIASGLSFAARTPIIRNLLLLMGITGFLGFGFYFVMLPLMTREIYQAEASFLAGLQVAFVLGGVFVSILLARFFGSFKQPGRIIILTMVLRGFLFIFVSLRLPPWLLFTSIFFWGVLSSFSAIVGRTMVQECTPVAFRARMISIYQMALFGVGPFGALFGGVLIARLGILQTTAALGVISILIGGGCILFKNQLWLGSNTLPESD